MPPMSAWWPRAATKNVGRLARLSEEHRHDHRHVRQMRAAVVRRVQHEHVARPHRARRGGRMISCTDSPIEPRCTGMCGAFAIRLPCGVEQRAGEVEALLDVDRRRGVRERHAHLLGDRHEQVVEDLEQHRIGAACRWRARAAAAATRAQDQVIARRHLGAPAGLDDDRGVALADDRRSRRSCRPAAAQRDRRTACRATRRRSTPVASIGAAADRRRGAVAALSPTLMRLRRPPPPRSTRSRAPLRHQEAIAHADTDPGTSRVSVAASLSRSAAPACCPCLRT